MSIISKSRELLKKLKPVASRVASVLPPVQAYNAYKTMQTPQYRQQIQNVMQTPIPQRYQVPAQKFVNFANKVSDPFNKYVQNMYVASARDLPKAYKQMKTPGTTDFLGLKIPNKIAGMGRYGIDVLGAIPDPSDLALEGWQYLKATRYNKRTGATGKEARQNIGKALTWEKPIGLGESITSNETGQMIGNIAELPLMLLAGRLRNVKGMDNQITAISRAVKKGEITMEQGKTLVKNLKKGVTNVTKAGLYDQYLVHGTTPKNAVSILKEGWKPELSGRQVMDTPDFMMLNKGETAYGPAKIKTKLSNFKFMDEGDKRIAPLLEEGASSKKLQEVLRKNGYDGLKTSNVSGEEYALLPEKVKPELFENVAQQPLGDAGHQYSKQPYGQLSKNLKVTDAYSNEYLGFNLKGMEEVANKKGYNLYKAMIEKVDSQTTVPEKIRGLDSILNDLSSSKSLSVKGVGEVKGKLPQQVEATTMKSFPPTTKTPSQVSKDAGQSIPSSTGIIPQLDKGNAVSRITEALKGAKPIRAEQEAIYSKIRSQQAGALSGIGKQAGGEAGYYRKLSQLKGEMPKVQFESIKKQVSQADVDDLFNTVEKSNIGVFEKVNAQTALKKLLGEQGGTIPTKSELNLLNEIFPPEFIQAVLDNRTAFQKLMSGTEATLNLPRAVMATADLSAPLRQGIFLVGRPKQFVPAFKDMFKYALSEKAYKGLADNIKARPTYTLMRDAKLALTDMGSLPLSREEAFMTNLAEKIPIFGRIAKGSNRAYSGFLNKLRADVFDDLVSKAKSQGIKMEGKVLEDLGSFINAATGRGNLGKTLQKAAPILNATFFSPRLMASRISLLNPVTYIKYDPFVRKEAIKSLLGFGATAMTIMGLAKLGGAEVGADPRSADFGKIKTGNTRYDVLGGFQQYIKLAAQLITGQVVSTTTGKIVTLGEGFKPLTRKDIIARFFEAKTAPVASFVISLLTGQTGVGEPVNIPTEIINRFIPMVAQDIYDIAKDKDSIGKGLLMSIPGIFGVGSQTYGKTELVEGKNLIGEPTAQIRPVQGLAETISEKAFGKQPLGSTSSWNAETYYNQLLKMPKPEAAQKWEEMAKTNPELIKKIREVIKKRNKGITVQDEVLKAKGVTSGERSEYIYKELNKLKTKEEKAALWDSYVKKGIITKDVAKQLKSMLK